MLQISLKETNAVLNHDKKDPKQSSKRTIPHDMDHTLMNIKRIIQTHFILPLLCEKSDMDNQPNKTPNSFRGPYLLDTLPNIRKSILIQA